MPFEALIMNEYDGRTEAGLKKAIERLYDEKKKIRRKKESIVICRSST